MEFSEFDEERVLKRIPFPVFDSENTIFDKKERGDLKNNPFLSLENKDVGQVAKELSDRYGAPTAALAALADSQKEAITAIETMAEMVSVEVNEKVVQENYQKLERALRSLQGKEKTDSKYAPEK